jgi:hypothetical protein
MNLPVVNTDADLLEDAVDPQPPVCSCNDGDFSPRGVQVG